MKKDDIIRLAEEAGIVFRLTNTDVTVEKLEHFADLAIWEYKKEQKAWSFGLKYMDVSRFARKTKPDPESLGPYIREEDYIPYGREEDYIPYGSRGWLWFWLRSEGGAVRRGINLTIIGKDNPSGCYRGFVLILKTKKHKYRFRFRMGIKPMFLWSKE